ncbi:MAG: DUF881 domain-containing protein [Streptosporangiales bacterium]|nr:DUF881 domain-containing protein [Streptosporangiales bacterium]
MTERTGGSRPRGPKRPDASMSLLADLISGRDAIDPGYAEAAARRAPGAPARHLGLPVAVVLCLLGLLLTVAVVQTARERPAAKRERAALIENIRDRSTANEELERQAELLRSESARLQERQLDRSAAGRQARDELSRLAPRAAAAEMSGAGLLISVDDGPPPEGPSPDSPVSGHIYDHDLQTLVNGLWAAGAQGIAINGRRLTATTAIRAAGEAILVDYRPISPPYEISVVGDPGDIQVELADSEAGRHMRTLQSTFGIRYDLREESSVELPKAGAPPLRYAKEVRGG